MVDQNTLLAKVNNIQEYLSRIHSKVDNDITRLNDQDIQDIVVFNLQRAIQISIDIAFHITSSEKLGLPQTLNESFEILQKHAMINNDIAEKMVRMTGFRNIVVYEYEKINLVIFKNVIEHHLKDIEEFYTAIVNHFKIV